MASGPSDFETEARALVEKHLGQFDDDAWGYWAEEVAEEPFIKAEQMAVRVIEKIEGARRNGPRPATRLVRRLEPSERLSTTVEPPEWWRTYSEEVLRECLDHQSRALELFDLVAPISPSEADMLITDELATQVEEGRPVAFEYAHEDLTFHRSAMLVTPAIAYTGDRIPAQRLHFFALLAHGVVRLTGCEMHQATTFLLTGQSFSLPWIQIETERFGGVIRLKIGNAVVPAADVYSAYVGAVDRMKKEQPEVVAPSRRQPRRKTVALIAFVRSEGLSGRNPQDWSSLLTQWNAQNPGWEFPSRKAMSESYRRAVQRAQQRKDA